MGKIDWDKVRQAIENKDEALVKELKSSILNDMKCNADECAKYGWHLQCLIAYTLSQTKKRSKKDKSNPIYQFQFELLDVFMKTHGASTLNNMNDVQNGDAVAIKDGENIFSYYVLDSSGNKILAASFEIVNGKVKKSKHQINLTKNNFLIGVRIKRPASRKHKLFFFFQ